LLPHVQDYLAKGCSPGGAQRNFDSYGEHIAPMNEGQKQILCDPQTSGGLLVAVAEEGENDFLRVIQAAGMNLAPLGSLHPYDNGCRIEIV
jgi:selenide,water dikinase